MVREGTDRPARGATPVRDGGDPVRVGGPGGLSSALSGADGFFGIVGEVIGTGAGDPRLQHFQPPGGRIDGVGRPPGEVAAPPCGDRLDGLEGLRRRRMEGAPARDHPAPHLAQTPLGGGCGKPRGDRRRADGGDRGGCRGVAGLAGATARRRSGRRRGRRRGLRYPGLSPCLAGTTGDGVDSAPRRCGRLVAAGEGPAASAHRDPERDPTTRAQGVEVAQWLPPARPGRNRDVSSENLLWRTLEKPPLRYPNHRSLCPLGRPQYDDPARYARNRRRLLKANLIRLTSPKSNLCNKAVYQPA